MVALETIRRGQGRPVLLLHGFQPLPADSPFLDRLAESNTVIAPSHPGFGRSPRPESCETVYDLVQLYLGLIDEFPPGTLSLVGCSFGGWLAAELAVAASSRLRRLVLVDALGIRIHDRDTPDILDIFNSDAATLRRHAWHNPAAVPDITELPDAAITALARDREALCRYAWHPYMHNPRLRHWLHRIGAPTLLLWGASDGIVTPDYGAAYAARIPGARLALIDAAGHHPEIEQPRICADAIATFLAGDGDAP